jgi:ATP synthase protein I
LFSLRIQTLAALSLAMLSLLAGPVAAYSSLFGSLAAYLPSLGFSVLVMRKIGSDSAVFLRTAVLAEFGKLVMTGLLCAAVFIWVKPLAAGFFFLGMIGVMVANWIGLARTFPA